MAARTGEPVSAGVGQSSPLGESIRRNTTRCHEFVHFEPYHNALSGKPKHIALRYTALQYTMSLAQ